MTAATQPLATDTTDTGHQPGDIYLPEVRLSRIIPSPENPASRLRGLPDLAASIQEHGVLEPLLVAPRDGGDPYNPRTKFDLVFGHRRYAAAQLAGRRSVPVIVRADLIGAKAAEARLVENLQRETLTPIEEAQGYQALVRYGYRQVDIAAAAKRQQSHVSKRLILLRLPPEAQNAVETGALPVNDAVDLARLDDQAVKHALADMRAGTPAPVAIRNATSWAEQEADRNAAIKSLQKAGVRVNTTDSPTKYDSAHGPLPLRYMPWVNEAEHAELPCHAALVGPAPRYTDDDNGGPVERWATIVCLQPSTHAQPDVDEDPEEVARAAAAEAARRARQERREQLDAATTDRHQFIRRLVTGRIRLAKTTSYDHLARILGLEILVEVTHNALPAYQLAATWLELDANDDPRAVVTDMLDGPSKPETALRASLALRLAVDELALTDDSPSRWERVHGPLLAEHLRYLQVAGYTPSDVEFERVAEYATVATYLDEDPAPAAV